MPFKIQSGRDPYDPIPPPLPDNTTTLKRNRTQAAGKLTVQNL